MGCRKGVSPVYMRLRAGTGSWCRGTTCLLSVLLLVLQLALAGCESGGGDDGGGGGGGGGNQFAAVTANDLANRSFAFPTGLSQTLAARLGLQAGQAFTLQFGNFTGMTGPMTFEAGGQTATGTVTLGSCTFLFEQSGFRTGQGPQAGMQFLADPCEIEMNQRFLRLTDPQSRETVSSSPGTSLTRPNVAFVLTADSGDNVGSYSVVDLATRNVMRDIRRGGVHSDARARAFGGRVYVVNRLFADNIQIIDPQQGFLTPTNAQVSVGNGSNPQDIAFVSASKAYVSLLASPRLLILNPTTLATLGEVDVSSQLSPSERDASPEPGFMLVHNGLLYVVLQHLDNFTPVAPGEVVVIDPATDRIVTTIQLQTTNPFSELHFSPTLGSPPRGRILVSCVGNFGVNDGRIVAIDPTTNTIDQGISITEAGMQGDITEFAIVSSTKGFAIISSSTFVNSLVTFNPSTGQRLNTVFTLPSPAFAPHLAINSRNELYLAVTDTATTTPGLRVFDTVTDRDLIPGPLNVGQLPPIWVLFLE